MSEFTKLLTQELKIFAFINIMLIKLEESNLISSRLSRMTKLEIGRSTGNPSSKYEHRRTSALLRNI